MSTSTEPDGGLDQRTTIADHPRIEALTHALLAGRRRKARLPAAPRRRPARVPGLTRTQRHHLVELLDAPFWHPETPGQWSCARSPCRLRYLKRSPQRAMQPYELTDADRDVALGLHAAPPVPTDHEEAP